MNTDPKHWKNVPVCDRYFLFKMFRMIRLWTPQCRPAPFAASLCRIWPRTLWTIIPSSRTWKGKKISFGIRYFFANVPVPVSVASPDLNPDPPDPHVFGPPESGSISQSYGFGSGSSSGSGSGSFYH
jgi:hypothetical protein